MSDQEPAEISTFPVPRERLCSTPAVYPEWRESGPVREVTIRGGKRARAVTRYDDVKAVLNSEHTSANRQDPRFPNLRAGVVTLSPGSNILHMDEPEHGHYRRMLVPEFTAKRIQTLRPEIQRFADEAIDRLLVSKKPVDFYEAVALPIPSQVICLLLGISYDNHEVFEQLTQRLLDMTTTPDDFRVALAEVEEFMRAEVEKQEAEPGDGVIGRLLVKRVRTGQLTREQLVGFSMLLLVGGHETSAKMITLGMLSLLTEPEVAESLRLDPSLMPGAVEEMLRIHSITDLTTPKLAAEDMSVGGCPLAAGDGLFPLVAAANHDPEVFPGPERFDPARGNGPHLTFGSGVHACLGQNLARAEMDIVFSAVLARVPTMRLAVPVEELEVDREAIVWGVKALPVTW